MDKASVIALRNGLLNNGKNRSIKIAFDNGIVLSLTSDLVVWDDEQERVIGFTADSDSGSYSAQKQIRIICSTYENIQFIMGNTNSKELPSIIDSLSNAVPKCTENKEAITKWFDRVFDYRYDLSHEQYDPVDIVRGKSDGIKEYDKVNVPELPGMGD